MAGLLSMVACLACWVARLVLASELAFGESSPLTEACAFTVLKSARVAPGSAVERDRLGPQVGAMSLSREAARSRRVRDEI
jgi:hypothetical protein